MAFEKKLSGRVQYNADYSSGSNDRSVLDKEYIDNNVGTGSTSVTANNGLTKFGDNIVLGGTLTGDTTISGGTLYGINLILNGINIDDEGGNGITISSSGLGDIQINPDGLNTGFDVYGNNYDSGISISSGSFAQLYALRGQIQVNGDSTEIISKYANNDPATDITLSSTNSYFRDQRTGTTAVGLEYYSDYSVNFTPRSLVDKGYVTGLTSASNYLVWKEITGTTYIIDDNDLNKVLRPINTGNTTITIPTGLTSGFSCILFKGEGSGNLFVESDGILISEASILTTNNSSFTVSHRGDDEHVLFGGDNIINTLTRAQKIIITGTTLTLIPEYSGKLLKITSNSTVNTVMSDSVGDNFHVHLLYVGSGLVTFSGYNNFYSKAGANEIQDQYGQVYLYHESSNNWYATGDLI